MGIGLRGRKAIIAGAIVLALSGQALAVEINLEAIKQIESHGVADAVNARSGAVGMYQITPIALRDFNRCTKKSYTSDDLFMFWINREIASWLFEKRIPQILKSKKQAVTERNLLISFNAGHAYVGKRKLPKETLDYIKRYRKFINKKSGG